MKEEMASLLLFFNSFCLPRSETLIDISAARPSLSPYLNIEGKVTMAAKRPRMQIIYRVFWKRLLEKGDVNLPSVSVPGSRRK